MARIVLAITIESRPLGVLSALDTSEGVAGWWCDDVAFVAGTLPVISLGLPVIAPARLMLRVNGAGLDAVRWSNVGELPRQWMGTFMTWSFNARRSVTDVLFVHGGWASDEGMFGADALGWARLLEALKRYVESGEPNPVFSRDRGHPVDSYQRRSA